ncbi:hypothetical protein ABH968_003477 [Lysinibacillus sp. RC79]
MEVVVILKLFQFNWQVQMIGLHGAKTYLMKNY